MEGQGFADFFLVKTLTFRNLWESRGASTCEPKTRAQGHIILFVETVNPTMVILLYLIAYLLIFMPLLVRTWQDST